MLILRSLSVAASVTVPHSLRSGESRIHRLFPMCGAMGLWHGGCRVRDGSVKGTLGRSHIGEGRVEARGLGGMAVVGSRGLVVRVVKLWPGDGGEGRTVVGQTQGCVSYLGSGGLVGVMTSRGRPLRFHLGLGVHHR